jgi:hypothetical protein
MILWLKKTLIWDDKGSAESRSEWLSWMFLPGSQRGFGNLVTRRCRWGIKTRSFRSNAFSSY